MENPNIPSVHLKDFEPITPDILSIFPEGLVRKSMIVPLARRDGRVVAAVPKTSGLVKPDGLKLLAGCPVDLVLAPTDEIVAFIKQYYPAVEKTEKVEEQPLQIVVPPAPAPVSVPTPAPVSADPLVDDALLTKLVGEVVQNHASEGIFDIKGENVRVRHRIRGVVAKPPSGVTWKREDVINVVNFVRARGESHVAEEIKWSEFQATVNLGNESYDCLFNLSETPNLTLLSVKVNQFKEKLFDLAGWGMDPAQVRILDELLKREQGVILFCGAEQDGAHATLNACVRKLAVPSKHVICVESYIDQWIQDADQFNAKGDAIQFSKYLYTALSHSPDILKVRPMDTREAWELCLRESIRGPLILGGAFARDAAEALVHILHMGGEASLVSSGLLAIVAQRRLRLNCQYCQERENIQRDRLREIGVAPEMQPSSFFYGRGCEHCHKTGFGNETFIFEIMQMNDEIKNVLHRDISADKIRAAAKNSGMLTLRQVAIHKAIAGQTSLAEVLRASAK